MPQRNNEVQFHGFCQIELNEDDFVKLDETTMSAEDLLLHIAALSSKGYRLSVTTDREAKTVKATLMDVDTTRSSAGWMLSAEAGSFVPALLTLLYKHGAKMGGDWRPFCVATREAKRYR